MLERGLSPHVTPDIDKDYLDRVLGRIITSYNHSSKEFNNKPFVYKPGHKWKVEIVNKRSNYIDALRENNKYILGNLFKEFLRNNGALSLLKYQPYQVLAAEKGYRQRLDFLDNVLLDLNIWREFVDANDVTNLEVPNIGNPYGCVVENVLITAASCPHHYYASRINNLLYDIEDPIVAEIGGGFGGMAYYLLKSRKGIKYINFDLPEILILAQYYLMMAYPEKRFLLNGENNVKRITQEIIDKYDVILMPNYKLPELDSTTVDLYINTHSLSEMDLPTVEEYISQITRTCRKYFFHENSYKIHRIDYDYDEIPTSKFPISRNKFKLIHKSYALWREERYREYLFERI